MGFLNILLLLLMLAVACALFSGIFFMLRGKEQDARRSNRMMVWRVSLQAAALAVLFILFLVRR